MKDFFGLNIPKLGFGLMRLPRLQDGKTIDVAQSEIMTDKFLEAVKLRQRNFLWTVIHVKVFI